MTEDAGDVLIVGAGPVGMLAALALAQMGASVTVIEADADLNDSPRAAIYFASTLVVLDELGMLEDVAGVSARGTRFGFHVPEYGLHAAVDHACMRGITHDYQLHCGQDLLTRIALEHATKLGTVVRFRHQLVALEQHQDSVTATVETPDGTRQLRTRWLIGCDGARSTVRRLLGLEFEGHTWSNRFIATNVYCDFAALGYVAGNFVCDPVYAGVIAQIDRHGLWRLTYQENTSLPTDNFRERLPERYAHFIPAGMKFEIKGASPYAIHQRCATSLRVGRALLAGDAAHATNPCGGLGLTTGVWDAAVLGDVLGAVLRGAAEETILDRYSDERRRVFWQVTSPGASENKRMMEETDPVRRRRDFETLQAAADDPALGRLVLSFPFKVIGDCLRPDSRWTGADPTAAAGIDLAGRGSQVL